MRGSEEILTSKKGKKHSQISVESDDKAIPEADDEVDISQLSSSESNRESSIDENKSEQGEVCDAVDEILSVF